MNKVAEEILNDVVSHMKQYHGVPMETSSVKTANTPNPEAITLDWPEIKNIIARVPLYKGLVYGGIGAGLLGGGALAGHYLTKNRDEHLAKSERLKNLALGAGLGAAAPYVSHNLLSAGTPMDYKKSLEDFSSI